MLVALVLLGGILLGGLGLAWQQRISERRLAAHRAAEAALENAYERLVGGALPLESGPIGAGLALEVLDGTRPGTIEIVLVALYEVDGTPFRRTLPAVMRAP